LEAILARTLVRVMGDEKIMPKKMKLKELVKLVAPLIPITGIFVGVVYLCFVYPSYNYNVFMMFLILWLTALDLNLIALYAVYLAKGDLWSSITELRLKAIRDVKLMSTLAHIFTAISIIGGGLALASYLIYQRAIASGLTKVTAPMTSQEAILTVLLLILLPVPAYIVKRETEKAIRPGHKAT
jgi:hypothetical protein